MISSHCLSLSVAIDNPFSFSGRRLAQIRRLSKVLRGLKNVGFLRGVTMSAFQTYFRAPLAAFGCRVSFHRPVTTRLISLARRQLCLGSTGYVGEC
jgi:hypothetical protein